MRTIRILGIALLLAACGSTPKDAPRKYCAWCNTDGRYLGPWRDTREEAEQDRDAHLKHLGYHAVRIDVGGG